jgi:solute carrier family 25 carnitine/acylcarnitine transporter 20/29
MLDCLTKTVKHEGVSGLYKGAASPLAGAMIHNAALFFSYGQARRWLGAEKDSDPLSLPNYFNAGAIAGFLVSIVETPMDLLKIKLQAQIGQGQYTGVFDAGRKIVSRYGVGGLYQGLAITTLRNTPAFGGYFFAFEAGKKWLTPEGQTPSLFTTFVAGGLGGFGFWGVVYPLDLIKSRIQSDSLELKDRKYKGITDCFRQTLKAEGWSGLFRGYTPSIVRAVPVNACVFLAVTSAKKALANSSSSSSNSK